VTLTQLAAAHGVATSYTDWNGRETEVSEAAVRGALAALGVDASDPGAALCEATEAPWRRLLPPTVVVRGGRGVLDLRARGQVRLEVRTEDGRVLALPVPKPVEERAGVTRHEVPLAGLPCGWHELRARDDARSATAVLLVAPQRIPALEARHWGWQVQLYALRSAGSWAVGDYRDLRTVVERSAADGAGVLLANPLHAESPLLPVTPSPYSPSSRRFRSAVALRVEDVPEYDAAPASVRAEVDALRPVTDPERVDRDAAWEAKLAALELLWPHHRAHRLAAWREEQGRGLEDFALFCALAEQHGLPWQTWPEEVRRPEVVDREQHAERTAFWCWVQLLVDEQLEAVARAAAPMGVGVLHDLAVGVDGGGADGWALQDVLALGTSVGAPPDSFNQQGQDWGLPPWRPDRLREAGYAPFRDMVRGVLRHAGGLRIDHVMGLSRLWWVPEGAESPADGTYVHYDADAMLAVLVLEATRAGAVVVGEDLGTVEESYRDRLDTTGVLGSAVLWFEGDRDPQTWRDQVLASVTTHDLPTAAGFLALEHVRVRAELDQLARPEAEERAAVEGERARLLGMLERYGLLEEAGGDAVLAMHLALVRSPARLVLAALGDAVGDLRQPNLPGTVDEHPNWRLPVADGQGRPMGLEELLAAPGVRRLTALLADGLEGVR
jgi:4-alpha-glucanotransferase